MRSEAVVSVALLLVGLGAALTLARAPEPAIPKSLVRAIEQRYPEYRVVSSADIPKNPSVSCYQDAPGSLPGVASGDSDGDGQKDYGLLIHRKESRELVLVAALGRHGVWLLEQLEVCSDCDPACYYVDAVPPGVYESLDGIPPSPEEKDAGYLERYTSSTQGLMLDHVESDGTFFFRTHQGWAKIA